MTDVARAERVAHAVKMMQSEAEGTDFEVRHRFAVMIPTLRGHKIILANMAVTSDLITGSCETCGQSVKVKREGTNVEGRAIENDCPAAEWRRP